VEAAPSGFRTAVRGGNSSPRRSHPARRPALTRRVFVIDEVEKAISIITLTDILRVVVLGDIAAPAAPAYPHVRAAPGPLPLRQRAQRPPGPHAALHGPSRAHQPRRMRRPAAAPRDEPAEPLP
jgi:hypothetical protein